MEEKELERILKALANRRRLLIVYFLQKEKEKSVGEIADHIKLSFKATSKHLYILANANALEREQRGLQMFYSFNKDAPDIVKRFLRVL